MKDRLFITFLPPFVPPISTTVETNTGQLIATGYLPTANISDNKTVLTDTGSLLATGYTPTAHIGYLLDTYSGAAYAYSFRKLSSSYSGNCIRVRRDSDNTEQDIGFSGDTIDESALTTFVGSNNGFIVTWYDQSGNGVNKTQTTSTAQPRIVASGTVTKQGGYVCCDNSSTNTANYRGMYNTVSSGGSTSQAFNVIKVLASSECLPATNTHTAASRFYGVMQPNGSSPTNSSGTPTYYKNSSVFTSPTRQDLYNAFNGVFALLTTYQVDLSSWTESSSLYPSYRGIDGYNFEEIVYYSTAQSRSSIETSIKAYYGL